jgi:hypothetical protein
LTDRGDQRAGLREFAHTTPSSMQLRRRLPIDSWIDIGRRIACISNASVWWLGDWIVYGEQAYGRRYKAALDATHLDYQTLRNYAWVARRFEPSRRREALSFQHHAEVAGLPEADQDLWLERAERLKWSRSYLRRQLKADGRTRPNGCDDHALTLHVPVPTEREQLWREAAAAAEQELVDWVAAAADQAAEAALSRPRRRQRPRTAEGQLPRPSTPGAPRQRPVPV